MIIEARVLSKEITTYREQVRAQNSNLLCCIDLCLSAALKTSFDYVLSLLMRKTIQVLKRIEKSL